MRIDKKSLNRYFDDAIDELEITYDVYFEIERYRRRCLHTVNRILSGGFNQGKALVFGSNALPFAMLSKKLGFEVEAISLRQTSENNRENPSETVSSAIHPTNGLQDEYDIIICDDILQHFASPTATLALLKNQIRPGGVLMVTTPNVARGSMRLRLLVGKNVYPWPDDHLALKELDNDENQQPRPYREYTLHELELLIESVGFELIQSEFIIGKSVNANIWPPLPLKEYFLQRIFQIVQMIVASFRSYLFVSARRP
jgi:SAM-dependent methyltransferase